MKNTSKQAKLIGIIVILFTLVLCVVNITYSYFSFSSKVSGTASFESYDVKFGYSYSTSSEKLVDENTLTVYPIYTSAGGTIGRGESFKLKVLDGASDVNINSLFFSAEGGNSYVRFWIDAYKSTEGVIDKTVNYGRYFDFVIPYAESFESSVKTRGAETKKMYYAKAAINAGSSIVFATGLTLLNDAPVDMLNSTMQITINFDAVQAENGAYLSVFDDAWGYSESWS